MLRCKHNLDSFLNKQQTYFLCNKPKISLKMENIKPAVPKITEKTLKELSPQEFQQMLSTWFQEKGIVQDMKSYLKFQMVNILRNTAIGANIKKCICQTYSLAQQAMHLIVAEYLLQNQCHFTLSIFSTEVNLSTILPQQKLFFDSDICNEPTKIFDKENLVNILELIGMHRNTELFSKVLNQYFDNKTDSLLVCLTNHIGKNSSDQNSTEQECKTDIDFEDDFMNNICQVLQTLNLPQTTQTKLVHNIKLCYDLKTKWYENQCVTLVNRFKKELNLRERKAYEAEKQKRTLEKRLVKLQKENESLKKEMDLILKEKRIIPFENLNPANCSQKHCNEKCQEMSIHSENYKKEIEILRLESKSQKDEIERLNMNCRELLNEFNVCQSKINLVNTKIQEDDCHQAHLEQKANVDKRAENTSSDSNTLLTEEVLQQARLQLKLLEEESEELDLRFSQFVIK